MDILEAQRSLNDKDLAIFNAELQRNTKSTGIAYLLWFFLGAIGVHNFYIGKVMWGLLYLGLSATGWFLFLGGFLTASGAVETGAMMVMVGIFALAALGLLLLWDLITMPSQLRRKEAWVKARLLKTLGSSC